MLKKNTLMIRIMALFFIIFFGFYLPATQRIPYLTSLGYTSTEMNIIFSAQAAIAFVYQLTFGYLCDKYRTIKKFFLLVQVIATIGVFMMFSQTSHEFYFHLLSIAVISSFGNVTISLLDSWALEIDPNIQKNYGAVRAMGTVGWIVGGFVVTKILDINGFKALGITYVIIAVAMMILASTLRDAVKAKHDQPITLKDMRELLFSRRYLLMVIILFFAMMLSTSDGLIVIQKMELLKATPMEKYLRFALQAVVELPLLFLGAKVFGRFKAINLLAFGIFMYAIRFLLYAWAPTPTWMIIVALMQAVSFPLIMIASKQLIFRESPDHLRSSGQMLAISVYNGIGASVTPLLTAFLIEKGGIDFGLIVLASIMVIPLSLIFYFKKVHA